MDFDEWFTAKFGREPYPRYSIPELRSKIDGLESIVEQYRMQLVAKRMHLACKTAAWDAWQQAGGKHEP